MRSHTRWEADSLPKCRTIPPFASVKQITWEPVRPGMEAAAATAAGSWAITAESPQGPIQLTFTLKQEGATISGEVSSPFGTFPLSGSLSGNELSFAFTAKIQDQDVAVSGKGSIDGNSIRGSMNAMGHDSNFSGTRTPR